MNRFSGGLFQANKREITAVSLLLLLIVPLGKSRSTANLLALAALPAVAIVAFSVTTWLHVPPYSHYVLYAITMPLGFLLLGYAIFNCWRRKSEKTAVANKNG